MRNHPAPRLASLACLLVATGCGSSAPSVGDSMSSAEIESLKHPSKTPPPGATMGPPPGSQGKVTSSLDPGYRSPGK